MAIVRTPDLELAKKIAAIFGGNGMNTNQQTEWAAKEIAEYREAAEDKMLKLAIPCKLAIPR